VRRHSDPIEYSRAGIRAAQSDSRRGAGMAANNVSNRSQELFAGPFTINIWLDASDFNQPAAPQYSFILIPAAFVTFAHSLDRF
jgi:hypothetical protein